MSYRYRCEKCRTTSPAAHNRAAVHRERDLHRDLVHGGHIPDGERIDWTGVTDGWSLPGWQWAFVALLAVGAISEALHWFGRHL